MGWKQIIQCCRIERDEELLVENERRNGCEFYCCQHATKEAMKYGTTGHTAIPDDQREDDFEHLHQFPTDCKFTSPVVPFAGELPVPIDKGRIIEVAGKIHPTAIRFSVNLACGTGPLCDLAFHFNPRFDQNIIVRCYRRNGRWGEEECAAPARNPLQRGSDFIITIFAGDKEFMVAINGKHYCSFAYRMELLHIRNVELHGDVTLNFIDYRMTDVYPEKIPTMPEDDVLTEDGILDSIPG